jgi:hypothetical protein
MMKSCALRSASKSFAPKSRASEVHFSLTDCSTGGDIVLAAMLVGAIRFDLGTMAASVAAFLGGIVVWGSNTSTAKEAAKEMAAAEADRAALIEIIDPRVIQ